MRPRKITNKELADLSEKWENAKVDTSEYRCSVMEAWEVKEANYVKWKELGGLCQIYNGKYYIA